ncbi:MAG: Gfo/Idh/MocA family oxidoreductase [Candidatus Melainabacteria bacterium]|nr:Gfo/Idh/MocA family oxidoreductase [Candidatus Melainabacteria bacterium]
MKPLLVGVVGCGYWGPILVRNFYENEAVELKYVCDLALDKLVKLHRRYPTIELTTQYKNLLSDPALDIIVIATPVHTHYELAKQALTANKHVLVEKPMCTTSKECRELIALAKAKGRILMVDHTFVYHGAVRRIKEEIERQELGELLYFDSVRINLGLFQSDINVVWDLAPHDLSIMDFLIGQTPQSVHATGTSHTDQKIEDIAYITLTFANNLIAHFHVSWLSPVKVRQILVGGTKKMIVYDDLQPMEKLRIYDKGITVEEPESDERRYQNLIQYRFGDMHAPVLDLNEALKIEVSHFVECVQTGRAPITDGEAGLRVVEILEAASASLATGQTQQMPCVGVFS